MNSCSTHLYCQEIKLIMQSKRYAKFFYKTSNFFMKKEDTSLSPVLITNTMSVCYFLLGTIGSFLQGIAGCHVLMKSSNVYISKLK